jgi:hypothetical protein
MSIARVRTTILLMVLLCFTWTINVLHVFAPFNEGERLTDFRTNYNQLDPRIADARVEADTDLVRNPLFYTPFIVIITLVAALVLFTNRKRKT